jgi:ATP-dependent exoDNAse (exonuclease V) beta subunit
VLKLQEFEEAPLEMNAGHFGILLHAVLGAFGREKESAQEVDAKKIAAWLREKLFHLAKLHFAPGPTFPINLQLEEAAQALDGFATAQAAHRQEGWEIIASENLYSNSTETTNNSVAPVLASSSTSCTLRVCAPSAPCSSSVSATLNAGSEWSGQTLSQPLEKKIILHDGRSMLLQGRIDRIDWHPERKRWMIIDYKTRNDQDWKKATPNREHFQKKGEEILWKDLQLPLYLKLASHWEPLQQSGLPLPTIETTDLCYFQLPIEPEKAGLSESFDSTMILPAWEEAIRLMTEISNGNFEALGDIDATRMPTLAALCGISVLS